MPTQPQQHLREEQDDERFSLSDELEFGFENNNIPHQQQHDDNRPIYPAATSNKNNENEHHHDRGDTTEFDFDFSPRTHPFARTGHSRGYSNPGLGLGLGMGSGRGPSGMGFGKMGNNDPTNEFMYQMPMPGSENLGMRAFSEGGLGTNPTWEQRGSQPLDLKALNERLQTLGLGGPSLDSFQTVPPPRQPTNPNPNSNLDPAAVNQHLNQTRSQVSPSTPAHNQHPQLASGFQSSQFLSPNQAFNQPFHAYPSVTELAPGDSISMYRPARAPSTIARSTRRGGTNVDPGESGGELPLTPPEEEGYGGASIPQDGASYWSADDVTHRTPRTGAGGLEDEMTVGPTSVWTRNEMGRDMYEHRDRLLRQESDRNQHHMTELHRQIREARDLASTATKLEAAEKQLRELQARLIAEQVARNQIEQESGLREEEMKNYQNEWASAVRALRRARDEGKKSEEEKRRIQRCFEEARDKLWKYHEALRVREARAQGKEEGRAEAWQEAERWMGSSPPIPGVEPVQAVPGAVLHQTPMMQSQTPGYLQSPTNQYFQQHAQETQQQPQQAQQQVPQMASPGQHMPMQSIAQLMEYFANNPGAFPQFNQPQPQHMTPQQLAAQPQMQAQQQQPTHAVPPPQSAAPEQMPSMGQTQMMPSQSNMPHTTPGAQHMPMPQTQHTPGQFFAPMQPQPTGQPSIAAMMPQQTGHQMPQQMMPQHTGIPIHKQPTPPRAASMPQPMMVSVMVPVAQPAPVAVPPAVPISTSQLPPGLPTQTQPTVPPPTHPTIPTQGPTLTQRTPRTQATQVHHTPGRQAPTSTKTQATRLPPAGPRTNISAIPHAPPPESVMQPHAAESYLERVDHNPSVKRMMAGARSKTIHSSAVPPTEGMRAPTVPHTAARSTFDDGGSNIDKPLPNPFPPSAVLGQTGGVQRSQTQRAPPSARSHATDRQKMNRRMSLSDGLHNSHANRISQIPDGDRYPAFPMGGHHTGQGRTHSRNTSFGSVDPAAIGLPASRDVSTFQSPNSEHRAARPSNRATPVRSGRTSARSRVAGALRNDMDLESELPGIQEAEEEGMPPHAPSHMMPSNDQGPGQMFPPQVMRQMQSMHSQGQGSNGQGGGRGPPRPAPSMPNMRHVIRPVMPQPLGGGPPAQTGPYKPFSEPRGAPTEHGGQGHKSHHSLSALFQRRDPAAARSEHLPEPESTYHPPKTHDIFVPPGLAPMAVSGGPEDVSGPRHSALGLSGVGSEDGHGAGPGGMQMNRMRAPTSSRSRSNHPPSAYFPASPEPVHPPEPQPAPSAPSKSSATAIAPAPPSPTRTLVHHFTSSGRERINLDSPPEPGTTRQTVIITERTDAKGSPAHEVSMSPSRSIAPTAYSGMSPPQGRSGPGPGYHQPQPQPHPVPLPAPKSGAPTMHTQSAQPHDVPLPRGGGTTYTAITRGREQPHQVPLPPPKSTAPTAYTHAQPQAHQVPLPMPRSIAPTAYTASPPSDTTYSPGTARAPSAPPEVRSIDFAQNVPLPRGGGTMYDQRTVVTSETDIEEPRGPGPSPPSRSVKPLSTRVGAGSGTGPAASTVGGGGGGNGSKKTHRKPVPSTVEGNGNGNGNELIDPRKYPLPASRAPTARGRASTYAASVPPIEEVTEPESGRENTIRRHTQASSRAY
ncbi:hypothetical protein I317_00738 [Kwoniella heveanensis CBS 569]|nr:hypothetical protein I317_00738 [Kwoniella heveanensis CBS 569]